MNIWNNNTEKIVKQIRDTSRRNRILHINQATKAIRRYNTLTVAGMIIGPTTGILAGSKEMICDTDHITTGIIIGLSVMSSVIISIIKFGNFDEMYNLHRQASTEYHNIENNINIQLITEPSNRINAEEYIKWIQLKYQTTFDKSPLIQYDEQIISNNDVKIDINNIDDDNILKYEMDRMRRN